MIVKLVPGAPSVCAKTIRALVDMVLLPMMKMVAETNYFFINGRNPDLPGATQEVRPKLQILAVEIQFKLLKTATIFRLLIR